MSLETKHLTDAEAMAIWPEFREMNHLHAARSVAAYRGEHTGNKDDNYGSAVLVEDGDDGWLLIFDREGFK